MSMEWSRLVSARRLGRSKDPGIISAERSPFQRDFDRIIFSSAFRRLQDKTQVFPLAESDYVRTRLTHSMETSSIARSLGTVSGVFLAENFDLGGAQPSDIGAIVAAAALAHDIGNPPLGHGGEESIRHWFTHSPVAAEARRKMTRAEQTDFERYEGNAHGFRVITRLQMPDQRGGLQLTCATLGAFAKYPCGSMAAPRPPGVAGKKYNFFQSEREYFLEIAEELGLLSYGPESYCRHPLAFLLEAADDIAYRIVDFEDGHMVGIVDYPTLERLFLQIIGEEWVAGYLVKIKQDVRKVEFLRAQAIGALVKGVSGVFRENQAAILAGRWERPLIEAVPGQDALRKIEEISGDEIYNHVRVAEVIAAGFELISGMLDLLIPAVEELAEESNGGAKASYRSRRLSRVIPAHYVAQECAEWRGSAYLRMLCVLDYIAGMTDSYAVKLYKRLKGISL